MFTHRYRYVFALLLSLYNYINMEFGQVYFYFNIRIEWYYAFATILLITFLILEGNRLLEPIIRKVVEPGNSNTRFQVIFFFTGIFISTISVIAVAVVIGLLLHTFSKDQNITLLTVTLMYAWLVNLIFHLFNTIFYYFHENRTVKMEAEKLKRISVQSESQLIKSRIDPHFLFNNLNVLSAMVIKDNAEANHFIEEFSRVYRYILVNQDKEMVSLNTELDYIKTYVFLLKKRFGDGLNVTIDIPVKYLEHFIIPASLQMLIENAIKHNIVSKKKPLHININANRNKTVIVSNNLQVKRLVEKSTGFGLHNILKRYELAGNKKVLIEKDEYTFAVTIPLLPLFTNSYH